MNLQERISEGQPRIVLPHTIYLPNDFFGKSLPRRLAATIKQYFSGIASRRELRLSPINETDSPDLKFAKAFYKLKPAEKDRILGWLRSNYCRVEGIDYKTIEIA